VGMGWGVYAQAAIAAAAMPVVGFITGKVVGEASDRAPLLAWTGVVVYAVALAASYAHLRHYYARFDAKGVRASPFIAFAVEAATFYLSFASVVLGSAWALWGSLIGAGVVFWGNLTSMSLGLSERAREERMGRAEGRAAGSHQRGLGHSPAPGGTGPVPGREGGTPERDTWSVRVERVGHLVGHPEFVGHRERDTLGTPRTAPVPGGTPGAGHLGQGVSQVGHLGGAGGTPLGRDTGTLGRDAGTPGAGRDTPVGQPGGTLEGSGVPPAPAGVPGWDRQEVASQKEQEEEPEAAILEALRGGPKGVRALARELGLPKSSVQRKVKRLMEMGLLEADEDGYRIKGGRASA